MDAREHLAILETVPAAAERSREVIDAVSNSVTEDEARERLRQLLGVEGDVLPQVVLDLQVRHMTIEKRQSIARERDKVRALTEDSSDEAL